MKTVMIRNSSPGYHSFKAESDRPITREMAEEAQTQLGYIPQGYDFTSFKTYERGQGAFVATWRCFSSCD